MNKLLDKRAGGLVLVVSFALAGCATPRKPPQITLDEPVAATLLPEPERPVEIVEVPKPLPLPGQLMPLPSEEKDDEEEAVEDPQAQVAQATEEARVAPTREGYVNAVQVWPFTDGALYQVYASPERVTVIAL